VAVRAEHGLAGLAEPLQMHLVAYAVAGLGEVDAYLEASVWRTCGRQVLKAVLSVLGRHTHGNSVHTGTPMASATVRHGAGRVLRDGLVYPDVDFLALNRLT
jgi:hypothetical protein